MEKSVVGIGKPVSVGFVLFVVVFAVYAVFYFAFAFTDCYPSLSDRIAFSVHRSSDDIARGDINSTTRIISPESSPRIVDTCEGKYIYIYDDLPSEFNAGLLDDCQSLSAWVDFCKALKNGGFGEKVNGGSKKRGWYRTNQFSLEVIFHERMRRYECLTRDSSRASAIFVPYYAGLDVGRHLWGSFGNADRDAPAERLAAWLLRRPEWRRFSGEDHFFVGGRVAWDFRRPPSGGEWGSRLMLLAGPANMTMLTIESAGAGNEFAVPYPTFFHPSSARQVAAWQEEMRRAPRARLFAFVGAPRNGTIRRHVIEECEGSSSPEEEECRLLRCDDPETDCEDPTAVAAALSGSRFCLQPRGDSFTRRSAFESVLAGCVPVFFDPASALGRYSWHFPAESDEKYSVYVPEADVRAGRVSVGEFLRRIPEEEVAAMREEVIRMIPRVVYADPASPKNKGFRDAFDISVANVLRRVGESKH